MEGLGTANMVKKKTTSTAKETIKKMSWTTTTRKPTKKISVGPPEGIEVRSLGSSAFLPSVEKEVWSQGLDPLGGYGNSNARRLPLDTLGEDRNSDAMCPPWRP